MFQTFKMKKTVPIEYFPGTQNAEFEASTNRQKILFVKNQQKETVIKQSSFNHRAPNFQNKC